MGQPALLKDLPPEQGDERPSLTPVPSSVGFMSTPARFLRSAQRYATRPGYFVRDEKGWQPTTWAQYAEQVQAAARGLVALGVQPGQVVCILGFNRPEWIIMDMAAMLVGAVPAGIYWTSSVSEVEYILNHSQSPVLLIENEERYQKIAALRDGLKHLKHVVRMDDGRPSVTGTIGWHEFLRMGEGSLQKQVDERLQAIHPEDPGTYIYTSGTTGPSKAVVLTHANLSWSAQSLCGALGATADQRVISYLPLAHVAEQMISVHSPALQGFPVYFARKLEELSDHLKEVRPTIFFGVPRVWEKMHAGITAKLDAATGAKAHLARWALDVASQWHELRLKGEMPGPWVTLKMRVAEALILKKVKAAIGLDQAHMLATGAAPISAEMLKFFTGLDMVIREVYGQSESCGATTLSVPGATKLGSVGRPVDGAEVRIADDGEIFVRGPHIFRGYAGNPAGTAEALVDGWLASGDLGHMDEEGYLYITGRKKDLLITSGGKNISPANIEADLMNTHLVEHAVVCGDGRHYLTAMLTLMPDALADFARQHHLSGEGLHQHPTVLAELQKGVDHVNTRHARVAHIRKFTVLPQSLTIESGELTPTMKVKRKVVLDRYRDVVDGLYKD
ncbi:long-chain fatty acid--CoA ligase [Aquabacterium sp.]|uniref:AMP-dependent synthetase/ligase n=1 Tax=Aquabacterium sp. TaxID=1872578 RepID=UPI002E32316D|nr:long-chain fatty acid--CoA ligase [Aquabacterium sp.]HEX5310944.1 long-chain fatty acid--CoA ligase [Aquabacterium sp.]